MTDRVLLDPSTVMEVETAAGDVFPGSSATFTMLIDDPSPAVEWYRNMFIGRDHVHYVASDDEALGGVVIFSVMMTAVQKIGVQYRIIVWSVKSIVRKVIEAPAPMSFPDLLTAVDPHLGAHRKLFAKLDRAHVTSPSAQNTLLKLENDEPKLRIKIGVLFAKQGQTEETAMYQNEHGSPAFEEFLDLLGDRVRLKGFTGYSAQLDTSHDGSGTHSVHRSKFAGYEIMFHVSTLLQYDPTDEQRIQRKRFIGNDIVMIVFMDGDTTYNIECMASQYTRVVFVVQPIDHPELGPAYAVAAGTMKGLRAFGPPVYSVYPRSEAFIETLLAKCINGEKATMASTEFVIRDRRTRKGYLDIFHADYANPKALRKKQLRKDNSLELIPVYTQDLAASTASAAQAFTLELAMDAFPHPISAVETHGDSLLFGTPEGLYISAIGSLECHKVVNMPSISQIVVSPTTDSLLVRTNKLIVALSLSAVLAGDSPGVAVVPARNPSAVDVATIGETTFIAAVQCSAAGASATDGSYSLEVFHAASGDITLAKSVPLRGAPTALAIVPSLRGALIGLDLDFVFVPFTNYFSMPVCTLATTKPMRTRLLKLPDDAIAGAGAADRASLDSAAVARLLAADALTPSAAHGVFPLADSGETLLCYDTFGVVLKSDLQLDRNRIFEWVSPPVHYFVASNALLVVVYRTFSEVYSLRNGSCIESHLVTSPAEYFCRGNSLYLPSWEPLTSTCSLYRLLPKPSPFLAASAGNAPPPLARAYSRFPAQQSRPTPRSAIATRCRMLTS
ncbi:uncharacterized protein AMSG_05699 [Thecamonas trahens ATCC 50062]|uniref:Rap-GAP domain-containing protein n=1 Tax=Thecamonas trahens ATCC 50062 TaxID=461836 RepID=A0A0L0DEA2_THETB|nr:hypothetical protein AMSG_05699 [Thecamonas trahens ATCC 50062]KNC49648.1 hypothetical protein AMSG_05699 [Thecamonas trahens ATCC 50062]|eukprot:XP_013757749.1 hypothetical protein AMSG_05699 [Thecamonas trahens ATCC 50062]